jgi:hypothetical protein
MSANAESQRPDTTTEPETTRRLATLNLCIARSENRIAIWRWKDDAEMPRTNFKRGDRVRIKETGQTGTVIEIRQHAPRGRSGYSIVEVLVRVDGVADPRPFQELELERI